MGIVSASQDLLVSGADNKVFDPGELGMCAYLAFREDRRAAAVRDLGGAFPSFEQTIYRLFREPDMNYSKKGKFTYSKEGHILHFDPSEGCLMRDLVPYLTTSWGKMKSVCVGVLVSDMVNSANHLSAQGVSVMKELLHVTNDVVEDAASNYSKLGDKIEEIQAKRGFRGIAEAQLTSIFSATIGRWASPREMYAVAKALTRAVHGPEHWDARELHSALKADGCPDEDMHTRLGAIMGAFLIREATAEWGNWRGRRMLKKWRSSFVGNARGFARAWMIDEDQVEESIDTAMKTGAQWVCRAGDLLKQHGTTALKVSACVAAGVTVAASLVVAAGVVMDWYYVDKDLKKLGPLRESHAEKAFLSYATIAADLAAVAGVQSDEAYAFEVQPNTVRIDPFFFYIKRDLGALRDETASDKLLANAFATPLLHTVQTRSKKVILVPASISHESMQHIQEALPSYYYRIVDRTHTHPELWVVRRAFEMSAASRISSCHTARPVVLIGGSVRQASKFPRVVANYGPQLTGRDNSRQRLEGTASQQAFFRAVNKPVSFGFSGGRYSGAMAIAPFSAQDIDKRDFVRRCIYKGITECAIFINIPVIMMDDRITEWDDPVLAVKYLKKDGKLYMTPTKFPVNGYCNNFDTVMSWVKPIDPIPGYDVVCEVVECVSSSFHIVMKIGCGPQEEHTTIWKMPDAGYYVLQDLTREEGGFRFFSTPAQKFDQVVKFLLQMQKTANLLEAAAGRIAGLEAPVRLGGVTLERSWELNHREFASVMVHAICCAALDKEDSKVSLEFLSDYYGHATPAARTMLDKAKNGWSKFLGIDKDSREIVKTRSGASDYDPVTHWTCFQPGGGSAVGEAFDEPAPLVLIEKPRKPPDKAAKRHQDSHDSGYESKEPDKNAETSSQGSGPEFAVKTVEPIVNFSGFAPQPGMRRVIVDEDFAAERLCVGSFEPSASYTDIFQGSSLCHQAYSKRLSKVSRPEDLLRPGVEFPAPDNGLVEIVETAAKLPENTVIANRTRFCKLAEPLPESAKLSQHINKFFSSVTLQKYIISPRLVIDGVAGSAKSSLIRSFIRRNKLRAVIVVPSKRLKKAWQKDRVGTVVTQHSLRPEMLQRADIIVVDEVYAYQREELTAYVHLATEHRRPIYLLGDRVQQYLDGGEMTWDLICDLGAPCMRMLCSNTMPLDAIKYAVSAMEGDVHASLVQTRNAIRWSIFFVPHNDLVFENARTVHNYGNTLVFKDRSESGFGWARAPEDFGFGGDQDDWNTISRVQGVRCEYSFLLNSLSSKTEKWYDIQRGLLYVAVSRHSRQMAFSCTMNDLGRLSVPTEDFISVEGRLVRNSERERFDAPFSVRIVNHPKDSDFLSKMYERGAVRQCFRNKTMGPVLENWRPWHKSTGPALDISSATTAYAALRLWSSREPYAASRAARIPVFRRTMGLWSMRRPVAMDPSPVDAVFKGLDRLAVQQSSKDEVLDLKNVIERSGRPREIRPMEPEVVNRLWEDYKEVYLDLSTAKDWSTSPTAEEWAETRTNSYKAKFMKSDIYGTTRNSVRSDGFLKTQTKVKLKAEFALEENYGQTVLATPADFNAFFGPWSKMFIRNLRLASRRGIINDNGYSDKELARELRRIDGLRSLQEENYQSDVSRQDTSHTPETLEIFCRLAVFLNVPEHVMEVYKRHSAKFEYRSMARGLYRGTASYVLGSGDPFTLARNIEEVKLVKLERYTKESLLAQRIQVFKGDDEISDKIPVKRKEIVCWNIRQTQLKVETNAPPYHAGRFLLPDDVVPDPIRMIVKAFVKKTDSAERANQLHEAFYDRYLPVQAIWYPTLEQYCLMAYKDFEPALIVSLLQLYVALENRSFFFDMISTAPAETRLVVFDPEKDCARKSLSWFTADNKVLDASAHMDLVSLENLCRKHGIPFYHATGGSADMTKRGVWALVDHAVAVVGLTEFNNATTLGKDGNHPEEHAIDPELRAGTFKFEGQRLPAEGVDRGRSSFGVRED